MHNPAGCTQSTPQDVGIGKKTGVDTISHNMTTAKIHHLAKNLPLVGRSSSPHTQYILQYANTRRHLSARQGIFATAKNRTTMIKNTLFWRRAGRRGFVLSSDHVPVQTTTLSAPFPLVPLSPTRGSYPIFMTGLRMEYIFVQYMYSSFHSVWSFTSLQACCQLFLGRKSS